MAVTLAQPRGPSPSTLMEKLLIEGGVPLSGTIVPAGNENAVSLQADQVRGTQVSAVLAERIRASFLAAGPLLARFGEAHMPPPGGDVIGRRRLDPHLDAFRALGATVEHDAAEI